MRGRVSSQRGFGASCPLDCPTSKPLIQRDIGSGKAVAAVLVESARGNMRRILLSVVVVVVIFAAAIQAVPYGRNHANPSARTEPRWDSERTRALTVRACFDCNSNQTVWPWYSNLAPVSWLTQRDVDEGRKALNFSEWDRRQDEARESAKTVRKGEMPPWFYAAIQPHARLTAAEQDALVRGLEATLGVEGRAGREGGKSKKRED